MRCEKTGQGWLCAQAKHVIEHLQPSAEDSRDAAGDPSCHSGDAEPLKDLIDEIPEHDRFPLADEINLSCHRRTRLQGIHSLEMRFCGVFYIGDVDLVTAIPYDEKSPSPCPVQHPRNEMPVPRTPN